MLRCLYSGVAGLKTHQTKMDVIGNNIANVNTNGFKGSRVVFSDVFYQTISGTTEPSEFGGGSNSTQIGYGSMVSSIDVLHTRSGYASTARAMDMAVDGEGYFVVQDANGNTMYTRVGQSYFDADGFLVDSNGNYIMGYPILMDGNNVLFETNTPESGTGTKIYTPTGGVLGDASATITTNTDIGGMLNDWNIVVQAPDEAGADPSISISGKTITVTANTIDEVNAILAQIGDATEDAAVADGATALEIGLWSVKQGLPMGVAALLSADTDALVFSAQDSDGNDIGGTDQLMEWGGSVAMTITGGVSTETGYPLLDVANGPQRIQKPNTLVDLDGNGFYDSTGAGIAEFTNISIGSDGVISGTTIDGKVIGIGQICLASIPNPEALMQIGNTYLQAVNNTGEITIEAAGAGSAGSVVSGYLEMSNVDLSTEFTDMITTQRGFQANSRIITVGDTMLEELINLKR